MQAAVLRCFGGIALGDLPPGLRIVCTGPQVRPPASVAGAWTSLATDVRPEEALPAAAVEGSSMILLVCDVACQAQVAALRSVFEWLDSQAAWPPLALLPVSGPEPLAGPELRETLGSQVLRDGCLDCLLSGEPAGFALALSVRGGLAKAQAKREQFFRSFQARDKVAREAALLESSMDQTLWDYAPRRLRLAFPLVDSTLGDEDGRRFAGYTMERLIGHGTYGTVYEVRPPPGVELGPGGEVVKAMSKWTVQRCVADLKQLQRTWHIMHSLSGRWRHPNIARTYEIYHSPTHFYIRMEHGGSENLYKRLQGRAFFGRAISERQLSSVVLQVAGVIDHLHTGPRVCHRDIKPENFRLAAAADDADVVVKLVDFDTAVVQRQGGKCKRKCGTFPFVAPDIAEDQYDGMAADMWSLGVLLLELAAGARVVETRILGEPAIPDTSTVEMRETGFPEEPVRRLKEAMSEEGAPRRLLAECGVPEVAPHLEVYAAAAGGLLEVDPASRWSSKQVVAELRGLSQE